MGWSTKEIVKKSNDSDVKELSIDIVSNAQKTDTQTQNRLADMIEAWSINLSSSVWMDELRDFCRQNVDIQSAYSVVFLEKRQFIIVVDDMTKDSVLDYNMFAFELRNKYPELKDFMVVDVASYSHLVNEFDSCKRIYKRG